MVSRIGRMMVYLTLVLLPVMSLPLLRGQTFQAQVMGTVTDASGAVVPGAQVTAKDLATGAIISTKSNGTGNYTLPYLRPGIFQITCEVSGFKRFEQGPITLQVDQTLEVNITLQPGEVTQKLTVSASAAPLATETGSLSQVVSTRSIENLPLNIRDPYGLIALTPGAIMGSNFGVGGGTSDFGRAWFNSDYYVGGGRSGSQDIMIDGAPNVVGDFSKSLIDPPLDSVQEFSVQATNYSAQFGRSSGASVNMVTKSGSNTLHGAAYDFERHSVTDANYFFNNRSGIPLPSWSRHQFGGNVGGPVMKGKWFFFGDYEGLRQAVPETTISTLPTAQQRLGDFSQTFASNGSLITIYDPSTLVSLPGGGYQRSPFANNIITNINPVAAAVVKYYPSPNLPGNAVTGANNYVFVENQTVGINKYDIRSDANLTDKTRMFARFSQEHDTRFTPGPMPAPVGGGGDVWDTFTQTVIDFTHVFNPTTVADVNISGSRGMAVQEGASYGFNIASLGLPASYASVAVPYFPVFSPTDVLGTDSGAPSDALQSQPRNIFAIEGSVSHQHGKHSLKFGEDIRWLHFNEAQHNAASGNFNFSRAYTQGPNPLQASSTAGFGFADFLLGDADSGSIQTMSPMSTMGSYYGLYAQDDWRTTSRLTLNLGLRWEVNVGNSEKYNRIAIWNATEASPLASNPGLSNLLGSVNWIGGNNPSNTIATDWRGFGPRFGFAYSLNSKTVIRGGYGIDYLPRPVYANGFGALETNQTTTMVASINGGLTPYTTISNPFPTGIIASLNDRNPLVDAGTSIALSEHPTALGYAQMWNFGVQRELPGKMVLDVHYWGNKGTHDADDATSVLGSVTRNIDQLPDQYLALGSTLTQLVPNPFAGLGLGGVLAPAQISRQQSLLPFPQYTGISQDFGPWGDSMYEAGSVQVERRLSSGLTFSAVYTRSKNIDDVRTPLDNYDLHAERALAAEDVPNNFRLSWVYSLPFGHGRAYGAKANRVVDAVLGGWDFNSFITLMSGMPIGISRPAVNNGQSAKLTNPTIAKWFNTSDFSPAAPYTFGNVGPVEPDVRTDWTRDIDSVLSKNFRFAVHDKSITAQFRIECFNLFNTPQFAAPNTTVTSTSFGQVTAQANDPRDLQFALKFLF